MTCRNAGHFFYRQSAKNRQQKTDNRQQKTEITSSDETDSRSALNAFGLDAHILR